MPKSAIPDIVVPSLAEMKLNPNKPNSLVPKTKKEVAAEPNDKRRQKIGSIQALILDDVRSKQVINKIFALALDDEHKDQMNALKWLGERIAPMSQFEDNKRIDKIQVNITTVGKKPETIDAEPSTSVIDPGPVLDVELADSEVPIPIVGGEVAKKEESGEVKIIVNRDNND